MNKKEWEKLREKCPWKIGGGHITCANIIVWDKEVKCSMKNCAPAYWVDGVLNSIVNCLTEKE